MNSSFSQNIKGLSLIFIFLALLSVLASAQAMKQPMGQIIDTIKCENSTDQSYALYLPSEYTSDKKWPAIFFFEPMARGRLPLALYAHLAEKYGFILIGSNNSKNGLMDKSLLVFNSIKTDSKKKFNIDGDRIYTSGFSGGARLAQYIANSEDSIAGVITIAGPKLEEKVEFRDKKDYVYFGIVGSRDMNFIEHKEYQKTLDRFGIKNTLLTYPSGHQWAPSKYFDMALKWLEIQFLLKQLNPSVDSRINELIAETLVGLDSISALNKMDKNCYLSSVKKSISPKENDLLNKQLKVLENDKNLMKSLAKEEKALKKEVKYYETIYSALYQLKLCAYNQNQPLDSSIYSMRWWQLQINLLQSKAKKDGVKGDAAARSLDVIRGQVFGVNLQKSAQSNLDFKLYLSQIQVLLYPKSVWVLWNQALIFAERSEKELAIECLDKAEHLDHDRLQNIKQDQLSSAALYPYLY
ncbi:MAG: hypothetical protein ABJH98_01845 [Reichenbachiella sp.]|uniref:hypothetical protein n=1 Tax=Reichenbachiella sp. TaxID=2184521 RepID=UPI00329A0B2A